MNETNRARTLLFRNMLKTPHRQYGPMVSELREAMTEDPDFVSRACVHLYGVSEIRDQVDASVITLLQAPPQYPEYREAGRCLILGSDVYNTEPDDIPGLPPFRVFRVDDFIASSNTKTPRQMKNIVNDYFSFLEKHPTRADGIEVRSHRAMKRAWVRYHLKGTQYPRIHSLLFGQPPEDSKRAILKQIAGSSNPREQMKLAKQHKIPYTVLASVLPKRDAATGIILIDSMSPAEALNSRAWVERMGLLSIPEVADAFTEKVAQLKSIASADHRKSSKGTDERVEAAIAAGKERVIRESQRIEKRTLLMVDRSSSMEGAIAWGREFACRIASLCDGLLIIAFNDYAQVIEVDGTSLAAHERAFKGIRASGMTSMQSGWDLAIRNGYEPEQVVIVTDEGENVGNLAQAIQSSGLDPHIVIVKLPGSWGSMFYRNLQNAGLQVDRFETDGKDYYLFDQVIALLGGPAAKPLVQQILETQLPRRVWSTTPR